MSYNSEFVRGQVFQQGLDAVASARRAIDERAQARRRESSALQKWQDYAGALEQKLTGAENSKINYEVRLESRRVLIEALKDELRRLDPNNRLLDDAIRGQIAAEVFVRKYAEFGLIYDPTSGRVSKAA